MVLHLSFQSESLFFVYFFTLVTYVCFVHLPHFLAAWVWVFPPVFGQFRYSLYYSLSYKKRGMNKAADVQSLCLEIYHKD